MRQKYSTTHIFIFTQAGTVATPVSHQVTSCRWTSYVNKWMRRDVIRRDMVKEYNSDRIRLNAIRKNKLLPRDLQVGLLSKLRIWGIYSVIPPLSPKMKI